MVGADPNRSAGALAEALGAEATFDNTARDPAGALLEFDLRGPRAAFECSGVPESLQQVFEACGPRGSVGILGIPMAPVLLLRMTLREQRAFSISGPSMESMHRAIQLLGERPEVGAVVTGTVSLAELDGRWRRSRTARAASRSSSIRGAHNSHFPFRGRR